MWFPQLSKGENGIEMFLSHLDWVNEPVYEEIDSYYNAFYDSADSEYGWQKVLQMSNAFNANNVPNDDFDTFDYDDTSIKKSDPLMKFSKNELIGLAIPMAFLIRYAAAAEKFYENKEKSK